MSHRRLILKQDPRALIMTRNVIVLRSLTGGTFRLQRMAVVARFAGRKEASFIRRAD